MKARLLTVLRWTALPSFYLGALFLFAYLTFPFERLKDRVIAEFDKTQKARGRRQHLQIEHLDAYWFTGLEASGVKLTLPPEPGEKEEAKPTTLELEEVHARLRVLPLLLGRLRVDFGLTAFGGEIEGTLPLGQKDGTLDVALEDIDLGRFAALSDTLGVPVRGVASGAVHLDLPAGKLSKAQGALDLRVAGLSFADGKTKIKGLLALPEAKLGDFVLAAEAKDGVLKLTRLEAPGPDVELRGDGKITLRESLSEASFDLFTRFRFADPYRGKSDVTKAVLGPPGSTSPSLFDQADAKIRRSKRPDGFYGWHVHGPLSSLRFDPAPGGAPEPSTKAGKPSPFNKKAPAGLQLPLGASEVAREKGPTPLEPSMPGTTPPASAPPAAGGEVEEKAAPTPAPPAPRRVPEPPPPPPEPPPAEVPPADAPPAEVPAQEAPPAEAPADAPAAGDGG